MAAELTSIKLNPESHLILVRPIESTPPDLDLPLCLYRTNRYYACPMS